ncbi:hypothetical protein O0882_04810 [Janthinobacterium sp. SUN073]|uniref:hypothetical protein n=1 Tax=Janthinobacterium sp. SUN073 TaxID=3004102 RepID=UPI0025AF8039|nr:hypothetical protein [Janthinobacterium sp. SUN073]MDN2695633.1 hypothetical protein [Janthinobacterium sp. SUN073]
MRTCSGRSLNNFQRAFQRLIVIPGHFRDHEWGMVFADQAIADFYRISHIFSSPS